MKVNFFTLIIAVFVALVIGYVIGYYLRKIFAEFQIKEAEELSKKIIQEADKEALTRKKSAEIEAKEMQLQAKTAIEKESRAQQMELKKRESDLQKKEIDLRKIQEENRQGKRELDKKKQEISQEKEEIRQSKLKYENLIQEELNRLEVISSYTVAQAKEEIKNNVMDEARLDAAKEVRRIEEKARNHAEDEARRIVSLAVQRVASDHVAESTISVVELPTDDIKGRIIGREGRNIRALEHSTGIDLIIDDTPGAVVLSGFDAIRREVARRALTKLTTDGRIHPGRIEEVVAKCKKELQVHIRETGEQAAMDMGINDLNPEIIKLLGRLEFRTSYTQNVLEHVKEVAIICGVMAAELGLDAKLAKRAGLLHDIGKAVDHQTDGTHTQLGVEIAKRYKEHKYVINAIAAHHEDVEPESLYAVLVCAGDTISASRPGARREMLETYIKRMTQLEEIGDSFKGVQKTYAIQAGREVRIIVAPDGINDDESSLLARDIAKRIEKEVTYPGEIKITVLRETRHTEYAR
ncbi:MAG: ribonuclease Y [Nitrospinales bacterium]